MAVFAYWLTVRFMGWDYDAAVMAAGHCGFGLGATPTTMANMHALVERFGSAPRAFLVVPMVRQEKAPVLQKTGAFSLDRILQIMLDPFPLS